MSEKHKEHVVEEVGDADLIQLYERYSRSVRHVLYRMTNDRDLVEDLTQQTFMRAFSDIHSLRDTSHFSTWLLSIARNVGIDSLRRRRAALLSEGEADVDSDTTMHSAEASSVGEWEKETELAKARIEPDVIDRILQKMSDPATEEAWLVKAIDWTLNEIKKARIETRSHDEEIAQLAEETRRLIVEMQRDLRIKVA
jgi:RNA polymerase sigma-70 factor, ECF subfamily